MAYSTIAQFRANVSIGTIINILDATVTDRIAFADKIIQSDLSRIINFSLIITTPSFIELLSQYKTAELCLVYMYGKKRDVDTNSDINYWRKSYDDLLKQIREGEINLVDGAGNSISNNQSSFSNTAKDGIEPALGMNTYGDWKSKADIKEDRPIE